MTPGAARIVPIAALVVTAACTEINASADHIAALTFDAFPAPAVVAGDSLRDTTGVVAPLRAIAFNGSGDTVPAPAIQYIALDTGVTIGANGTLFAARRSGSVRIIASAGNLQSPIRSLIVTRRPDSVAVSGKSRDTVMYVVPDAAATNVSAALGVRVITRDTTGGIAVTQGWTVSYQAFFRGNAIVPGDTTVAYLLGDGVQRSTIDTTGSDGVASRRVRIRPIGITATAVDSVVVIATIRYRGAPVAGGPLRFVVLLRPKQ